MSSGGTWAFRRGALRRVALLAANDVRLTVKDKSSFVWMLLLPIVLIWFFGTAFSGGSGGPPRIALAVDDRDGGWLARALVDELADEGIALTEVGAEGGEKPAAGTPQRRTAGPQTLVLPAGLTAGALAGEQQEVRLEVDPEADRQFGMGAEVHVRRAIVRVLARLLELELSAEGEPGTDAETADRYRRLAAAPKLVELSVSTAGAGTPIPRGFAQSVPGMLTMIVLMMNLIYGGIFLILEKEQGMLRRQLTLPVSRGQIISAKLVGRLLIAALQIALLLATARVLFGLSLGRSPTGLLFLTASYALAVACLSILLGAVFRTPEQASSVGWILSMVLAGLGGCWWPGEVMPEWLQTASHALPTAWAMDGFHALISFGRGVEGVVVPSLVLLGFGALFGILGARFLRAV